MMMIITRVAPLLLGITGVIGAQEEQKIQGRSNSPPPGLELRFRELEATVKQQQIMIDQLMQLVMSGTAPAPSSTNDDEEQKTNFMETQEEMLDRKLEEIESQKIADLPETAWRLMAKFLYGETAPEEGDTPEIAKEKMMNKTRVQMAMQHQLKPMFDDRVKNTCTGMTLYKKEGRGVVERPSKYVKILYTGEKNAEISTFEQISDEYTPERIHNCDQNVMRQIKLGQDISSEGSYAVTLRLRLKNATNFDMRSGHHTLPRSHGYQSHLQRGPSGGLSFVVRDQPHEPKKWDYRDFEHLYHYHGTQDGAGWEINDNAILRFDPSALQARGQAWYPRSCTRVMGFRNTDPEFNEGKPRGYGRHKEWKNFPYALTPDVDHVVTIAIVNGVFQYYIHGLTDAQNKEIGFRYVMTPTGTSSTMSLWIEVADECEIEVLPTDPNGPEYICLKDEFENRDERRAKGMQTKLNSNTGFVFPVDWTEVRSMYAKREEEVDETQEPADDSSEGGDDDLPALEGEDDSPLDHVD